MSRTKCLIIDNNPEHQELATLVLEDLGLDTRTCECEPSSWDYIVAEKPALLIIDLEVGHETCWELLDRIHRESETRSTPVICLSTDQELLDRAQSDCPFPGGGRFIQKPYDIQELENAVTDVLPGMRGAQRNAGTGNLPAK